MMTSRRSVNCYSVRREVPQQGQTAASEVECVDRAIKALRAHESYIGSPDAGGWVWIKARETGGQNGYQYAVNFRALEL